MKKAQAIGEYKTFGLGNPYTPPEASAPAQTIYPKIPYPQYGIIPDVIKNYKKENKTEEDEQEFLDLLEKLSKDDQFKQILAQYDASMRAFPDRTEEYEMKAMNDFVELNSRIAKPE